MSAKPLVSVVIPTCNRRDILARCLHALAEQTHSSYEVIVVDDGSTDDTPDFLASFAAENPELDFRWLRNEPRAGANPSRNRGIRAARGEFVALLDNDCIAEPDWLEKLVRGFTGERVAAVTGLVIDPPPTNIYELTFKGTHRLGRAGPAHRLVAGNMCVRRELLLKYRLDEDRAAPARTRGGQADIVVSGRGDEEGLFLLLRAAGYQQRVVPDAAVLHEHPMDRRSFYRQAFRGGRSAARLVYKYHLRQRLDMLPFVLTYAALPLVLIHHWLVAVPLFCLAGALAAIAYNDLCRKGKTIGETVRSFPLLLLYYHVRLSGYVAETLCLRLTKQRPKRVRLDKIPREFSGTEAS